MPDSFKFAHIGPRIDIRSIERIDAVDGHRWAYSRQFKKLISQTEFEIVVAWVCCDRQHGFRRIVYSGVSAERAQRWVKGELP